MVVVVVIVVVLLVVVVVVWVVVVVVIVDEVTEAFAKEVLDALVESELARLVLDVDRPVDKRSKTFEPEDL